MDFGSDTFSTLKASPEQMQELQQSGKFNLEGKEILAAELIQEYSNDSGAVIRIISWDNNQIYDGFINTAGYTRYIIETQAGSSKPLSVNLFGNRATANGFLKRTMQVLGMERDQPE